MQFYGKAETAASRILDTFRSGKLPQALAPVFIKRRDNVPCRAWSWSNQLITALIGYSDARGFRQWEQVGRHVRKGERAFYILVPLKRKVTVTDEDTGDESERMALYGFKGAPVFGYEQTDGEALPVDAENEQFIDGLPLVSVARSWGISVDTYNGASAGALGFHRGGPQEAIALGVKNLATWAHELIHAADQRNVGKLRGGQHLDQEVVAELGGATLLACLGLDHDADAGGAWRYIEHYAAKNKRHPLSVCEKLLSRVCEAVALILDTADELATVESGVAA